MQSLDALLESFAVGEEDDQTSCGPCGGTGIDHTCTGHETEAGLLFCGCPACGHADVLAPVR